MLASLISYILLQENPNHKPHRGMHTKKIISPHPACGGKMQMLYWAQTNLGGTAMLGSFNPWKHYDNYSEQMFEDKSSDLPQWPIKLWQVPEVSPYFHHAHLLIAADCSAFACPTFHDKLSKGKVPLLCCPATDFDIATRLEKIFSNNEIASITVVKMEKACCQDMLECVFRAAKMSRLPIPIQVTNLFVEAEDVTE
jgi:hypothetical protein